MQKRMTEDMMNEDYEMVTQSTLISEYGWTKKLIEELLSKPQLRPNPQYKSAAPMKLWSLSEVARVMNSPEFLSAKAASDKRRATAMAAVQRKKSQTMAEMGHLIEGIYVRRLPYDEVCRRAIQSKEAWAEAHGNICDASFRDAPQNVKDRWTVNYIRHNLTDYDNALFHCYGRVGKGEAISAYRDAVLDKIAGAYPRYAAECARQKLRVSNPMEAVRERRFNCMKEDDYSGKV